MTETKNVNLSDIPQQKLKDLLEYESGVILQIFCKIAPLV